MRKHFKYKFPAFIIPRRNEAVAADTIFSHTTAVDSGVTMALIFIDKDSLVSDVYAMQSFQTVSQCLERQHQILGSYE